MTLTNEDLLAISRLLDTKLCAGLKPMETEIHTVKNAIHQMKLYQENAIMPRLNTIESCYMDTYIRYKNYADKMEAVFEDVKLIRDVVTEHSEKIQKLA